MILPLTIIIIPLCIYFYKKLTQISINTAWGFAEYGIENFKFIVSERVQVNAYNLEQWVR